MKLDTTSPTNAILIKELPSTTRVTEDYEKKKQHKLLIYPQKACVDNKIDRKHSNINTDRHKYTVQDTSTGHSPGISCT